MGQLLQLLVFNILVCQYFKGKEKEAPKKNDRASPTKKTPPAKGTAGSTIAQASSNEGRITPGVVDGTASPSTTGTNALLEKKYREKLTAQVCCTNLS